MKKNIINILGLYLVVLISSVIVSLFFSWLLFGQWYEMIFKPTYILNLLTLGGRSFDIVLGGFLLAYALFLPIFSIIFISKKSWLPWLIFSIPLLIFYLSSSKWLFWFVILTVSGTIIGIFVKYVYKKIK